MQVISFQGTLKNSRSFCLHVLFSFINSVFPSLLLLSWEFGGVVGLGFFLTEKLNLFFPSHYGNNFFHLLIEPLMTYIRAMLC